jgi:hypothetical protein
MEIHRRESRRAAVTHANQFDVLWLNTVDPRLRSERYHIRHLGTER